MRNLIWPHLKKVKNEILKVLILVAIFSIASLGYVFKTRRIDKCPKYIIVKPSSLSGGYSSTMSLHYEFTYENQVYQGRDGRGIDKSIAIGDHGFYMDHKYLVRFNCKDASESQIMWDIFVPDTLTNIPINGWDKIPYRLDTLSKRPEYNNYYFALFLKLRNMKPIHSLLITALLLAGENTIAQQQS